MRVTQIFLLFYRNSFSLFDLQIYTQNSYLFTYNTFIKILYMFRALPCSSSGGLRRNCIYAASGIVTLCRWLSCAPVKKESRLFFFVYRHSDLKVSCSNGTKTSYGESRCCLRALAVHEITYWVGGFETFRERNFWACDVCAGEVWAEGGFTLALFQGWGMESEVLLEQV
jgi:hypothetical protein